MYQTNDLGGIPARVASLRARDAQRDTRVAEVQAVRRGDFEAIAPDLFSDEFKRPIVANLIDTAARDMAAMIAPLPSFNCSAASGLNEKAKTFADKRTKIARAYVDNSGLDLKMLKAGDHYNTFGLMLFKVDPDFEDNAPRIKVVSPVGAYVVNDHKDRTVMVARVFYRDFFSLLADYPQLEDMRRKYPVSIDQHQIEVVEYVDDKRCVIYLPKFGDCVLEDMPNKLGKCYYQAAMRPNFEDAPRGAYDDVIWVQLARHRIQMLLMEGVDKAVRAPLVVPMDVDDVALGPDGVIHTQQGAASVGRARLDMPAQAFSAVEQLKSEQWLGSMSSEARSGTTDASVITGRGMQELAAGFNSQIAVAQTVIKATLKRVIALCFEMDEKVFGHLEKEIRGNDSGIPYGIKYQPRRDIDGDHSVDISYGFASGLDPNRALVFLLQADGAGLVSKDYIRRAIPVDLNAAEEEKKIMIEQSRMSLMAAISGMAQSLPQIIQMGGDPLSIISQQAKFIELLGKGKSVEVAAREALTPEEKPQAPAQAGAPADPAADPMATMMGAMGASGGGADPNARPDLAQMFAGIGSGGDAQLTAGVSRQQPVAGQ